MACRRTVQCPRGSPKSWINIVELNRSWIIRSIPPRQSTNSRWFRVQETHPNSLCSQTSRNRVRTYYTVYGSLYAHIYIQLLYSSQQHVIKSDAFRSLTRRNAFLKDAVATFSLSHATHFPSFTDSHLSLSLFVFFCKNFYMHFFPVRIAHYASLCFTFTSFFFSYRSPLFISTFFFLIFAHFFFIFVNRDKNLKYSYYT